VYRKFYFLLGLVLTLVSQVAGAADWPAYRHDLSRSGSTGEQLDTSKLASAWMYRSATAPSPAWPGPAKWDAYKLIKNLPSMRNYDPCFHLIAAEGAVYYGSSSDDSVHKLDNVSGETVWTFTTGGPIRIAPMFSDGRLYFGSDDGYAYCVDAKTGQQVWKYSPAPDAEKVWNNGRAISFYPVRTGVVVRDGRAYFGAALLPWKESYLVSVDHLTGKPEGEGTYVRKHNKHTMEGAMLATDDQLIIPQGRVAPKLYKRSDGGGNGSLKGSGGVFVVITPDQHILHGPGGRSSHTSGLSDNSGKTAKIAAFERGNSLVVSGNWAFVLQSGKVIAIDRSKGSVVWEQSHDMPLDLILAGDTLFVGAEDRVTAYKADDGKVLWRGAVEGRSHGLVVANGSLLVSTDIGAIHCFKEMDVRADSETSSDDGAEPTESSSPQVDQVRAKGLIGRWVMHRSAMRNNRGESINNTTFSSVVVMDQAGEQHATLKGAGRTERFGEIEAIYTDSDSYLELADDVKKASLPTGRFTVEAWVRVDQPLRWGGLIGCIQDNGGYERGWVLGYQNKQFCFGLNAEGGRDGISYTKSNTTFNPGDWAHVIGSYDGKQMRLYVNGRLETTSTDQSGNIKYAEKGPFVIGAFKDENEDYRMTGMIHEVRMYDLVLRDRDVKALFNAKSANFPEPGASPSDDGDSAASGGFLASGPSVRFLEPGKAEVIWRTHSTSSSEVNFFRDDETIQVKDKKRVTDHRVVVEGLRPKSVYQFQITQETASGPKTTRSYECDTYFNYTLKQLDSEEVAYEGAAELNGFNSAPFAKRFEAQQGIVLLLGFDGAHAGYQLAKNTRLRSIHVLSDSSAAASEQRHLVKHGVYGERVTVMSAKDLAELRLPSRSFDAVILSDELAVQPSNVASIKHMLVPGKGVVAKGSGEVLYTAAPLAGSGVWSHMYGTPENNSFGGEHLANATNIKDLEVQWVGRPGPRYQSDRQNRKPAPLAVNGRLYMQGLHRLIAANQYNGSILWSMEIPEMQRWNVTRDASNWCADEDYLYVAVQGEVWKIQGVAGEIVAKWPAEGNTKGTRYSHSYDFGYIAREQNMLVGSSVRPGTIFAEWWGKENWYDQHDGEKAAKVASDKLFALDVETGKQKWVYSSGLVLNSTICIAENRVFFIRVTNPEILEQESRRLFQQPMWDGLDLVALDLNTGREVYAEAIKPMPGITAFYMVYSQGKLLISSSAKDKFSLYCMKAETAKPVWDVSFGWQANHHGKHLSRPAVSGNLVYLRPKVLDLETGKEIVGSFPKGHQCGTYALTTKAWFARAGTTTMWSVDEQQVSAWDRIRTDCWLSTIPAGGMVLSPEGGGGCSCGTWIETSLGFLPQVYRRPDVKGQ